MTGERGVGERSCEAPAAAGAMGDEDARTEAAAMDPLAEWVRAELFALADADFRTFNAGLIPTMPEERIIGVRMPALRKLEGRLAKEGAGEAYLAACPHAYLEEGELCGLIINRERAYDAAVRKLEEFLPHVDNWAVCDLIKPAAFKDRPEGLEGQAFLWMRSGRTYTVRFGVEVLMNFFLDEGFRTTQLDQAAAVPACDYYVEMAVAWYFATALAKRWDETVPYLEGRRLPSATHAKAIRKARESYRITPEQKDYLRTLR